MSPKEQQAIAIHTALDDRGCSNGIADDIRTEIQQEILSTIRKNLGPTVNVIDRARPQ